MRRLLAVVCFTLFAAIPSFASDSEDHVGVGQTITVPEDASVGDIVCAFCTVRVHGGVSGDVVMFFGRLEVDNDKQIDGDVVGFGTRFDLKEGSSVGGDLVDFAGAFHDSGAKVHGDRVLFPSPIWIAVPFAPLLILIGVIWLIVHYVRVRRQRFYYPPTSGTPFRR